MFRGSVPRSRGRTAGSRRRWALSPAGQRSDVPSGTGRRVMELVVLMSKGGEMLSASGSDCDAGWVQGLRTRVTSVAGGDVSDSRDGDT
jgi:hypothetical protein